MLWIYIKKSKWYTPTSFLPPLKLNIWVSYHFTFVEPRPPVDQPQYPTSVLLGFLVVLLLFNVIYPLGLLLATFIPYSIPLTVPLNLGEVLCFGLRSFSWATSTKASPAPFPCWVTLLLGVCACLSLLFTFSYICLFLLSNH